MPRDSLAFADLTFSVIGAFFEVFNILGCGFLEHLYVMALERELRARGHRVEREVSVRVTYKGEELGWQRIDMLVDDVLIVEVKSTFELPKSAKRQVYNYLRATGKPVGLLLHFGIEPLFYRLDNPQGLSARRRQDALLAKRPMDRPGNGPSRSA